MAKLLITAMALILVAIGMCAFAGILYVKLDIGRTVYNHRPGACRHVTGPVEGSEDIELIRSEGLAFITSGVMYALPQVEGKIFIYDFNQTLGTDQDKAEELPIIGASFDQINFHPHGISHWVINGTIRLYVINHDDQFQHSIQVFDYDPSGPALIHRKSLQDPTFIRPNNIVAVGPDQFIFVNDGVAQSQIGIAFEGLTGYKSGSVYFWDGKVSHEVFTGLGSPTGITYDIRNNKLFITEISLKRMQAYDLAKDKKTISLLSTINLFSACDNLFLDSDGSVYVGCHPVMFELAKSLADCSTNVTSPSQVLHLTFGQDYKTATVSEPKTSQIYANDGKEVSGSSVPLIYANQMLIGTVCKGLLHCEIIDTSVL